MRVPSERRDIRSSFCIHVTRTRRRRRPVSAAIVCAMIDPPTMRRLLLHEARVHAIPNRDLRDLGDAILLHDPVETEPFWNRLEGIHWPGEPDAFDRRLTEILVLFASIGRRPHIWASPAHDAPTDLVARLAANGFRDMGPGCVMALVDPRPVGARRDARRRHRASPSSGWQGSAGRRPRPPRPAVVEVLIDAFDVDAAGRSADRGREHRVARPSMVHPVPRPRRRHPGRGGPAGDLRGRELSVLDRHRRLGARARPGQSGDPARGGRGRGRRQRVDVPRGLRRQRRRDRRVRASRVRARRRAVPGPAPVLMPGPPLERIEAAGWPPHDRRAGRRRAPASSRWAGPRSTSNGPSRLSRPPWTSRRTHSSRPRSRSPSVRAAWSRRRRCPAGSPWPSSNRRPRAAWRRPWRGSTRARTIAWYAGPGDATAPARGRRRPGPFGPERLVRRRPGPRTAPVPDRGRAGYHRAMTDQATIALRPAGPADAESIAALFTDEGYPAGPSDIVARLERFATPEARVVVAEHDGALLGFIAFCALPRFEHDDWIVRIVALVVDAGARERGVGPHAHGRGGACRHGARSGLHRGHRRPPPPGRSPSLRVDRLRRVRHGLPPQEAARAAVRGRTRPSLSPSGHAGGGDDHRTDPVIRVRGLVKRYGDIRRSTGSTSTSRRARCSDCSVRTGPARPRRSRSSRACEPPTVARRTSSLRVELRVVNPATLEEVGVVDTTEPEGIGEIVAEARLAQERWARQPAAARTRLLRDAARVLLESTEEIAARSSPRPRSPSWRRSRRRSSSRWTPSSGWRGTRSARSVESVCRSRSRIFSTSVGGSRTSRSG